MTVSESVIPCDSVATRVWSEKEELESKEIRARSSPTSGGNKESLCNPALDGKVRARRPLPKGPMNLVLKTRIAKVSQREDDGDIFKTRRSFTTHSTEVCTEEKLEEEETVTDDGPVVQNDMREEEVYKKLNELSIVPDDHVPEFVETPVSEKNKSTPATSTSSCPSFHSASQTPIIDVVLEGSELEHEDSSESSSVLSDISGLTGKFTRLSSMAAANDSSTVQVLRKVHNDSQLLVSSSSLYEEEEFKIRSILEATAKQPPERKSRRRRVSFSTVTIREYERILGDNPSVSCGPSISIGWEFDEEEIMPVDEWESWRETEREPERLVLSRDEREDMLLDLGYNQKAIVQAVREIIKVKNKRRQTITNLGASGMEELMETAGRKVKNIRKVKGILSLGRRKQRINDDDVSVYA